MHRETVKYALWTLCVTLWGTLCFILPDFADNPFEGLKGLMTLVVYIAACSIGSFFLLYLAGINKYVCAVVLPLYGAVGAVVSFYRHTFHVTVTPMIIDAALHTNPEEAAGVVSWQLAAWVLFNTGTAVWLCRLRFTRIRLSYGWAHALAALLLGVIYYNANGRLRNSLNQRYPYNIACNMHEYRSLQRSVSTHRTVPPYRVTGLPDSVTVVVILGEAARADHLQLNGYPRATTPQLARRNNVVSYPYIYSEYTHTLASLPYILTRADSTDGDRRFTETSFVTVMRKEGFTTAWISNQDMGSTFAPFISECDTSVFVNAGKSTYVFSPWLDEDLLPVLDAMETHPSARNLYILHTIGSHWYYNNHVPQMQYFFRPVTGNRLVVNNSIEQIVNSYDNTIRYMDSIVDAVIARFVDKKAVVLYQADHSEALGEDGEFLHANETEYAKHPACVIWYSDKYALAFPDKVQALHANRQKRYRTDYFYYSVLSAAGIEADGCSAAVDIFSAE